MNGLAVAAGVYVISIILEDTLRTAIADIFFERIVQSCVYQSIVWFAIAFVGSFIARRNFVAAMTLVATVYWLLRLSHYLDGYEVAFDRPTDMELLVEFAPVIFLAIVSTVVGALAGQRFGHSASAYNSEVRYAKRKQILFWSMLGICIIAPQSYSAYWFAAAQGEVRKALNSMKSGTVPENVRPFTGFLVDKTEDLRKLMDTYSNDTEVLTVHKFGEGFHSYEIRIISSDESPYYAFASYIGGEWSVDCCSQY